MRSSQALPLPGHEPVAWYRDKGFTENFSLGKERPDNATSNPNEWVPLYLSPSPSIPEEKGGTAESVALLIAKNALANEARRVGPLTIEDMSEVFSRLERTIFASPTEGQTVKEGATDE